MRARNSSLGCWDVPEQRYSTIEPNIVGHPHEFNRGVAGLKLLGGGPGLHRPLPTSTAYIYIFWSLPDYYAPGLRIGIAVSDLVDDDLQMKKAMTNKLSQMVDEKFIRPMVPPKIKRK